MEREILEEKLMEAERQLSAGVKPIPFQEAQKLWRQRIAQMQMEAQARTAGDEAPPSPEC